MSNPPCENASMKNETVTENKNELNVDPVELAFHIIHNAQKSRRVRLEPELEEIAAFWSASKRLEMARKFKRWARQLRVSGVILFRDSHQVSRPALPFVGPRKARLN